MNHNTYTMDNNGKPTLLIIEDHKIVSLGLKSLAESLALFSAIDSVQTARQALEFTVANHPTVCIVDVELPDMSGIDLVKSLRACSPDSAFIFHTFHQELWTLRQMILVGANAIVMKTDDPQEMQVALKRVLAGDSYYSDHFREACEDVDQQRLLSPREIDVLRLVAQGKSTNEIARQFFVSPNTIEFHRKNIMRKLRVSNMAQLVSEGIAQGYINKL